MSSFKEALNEIIFDKMIEILLWKQARYGRKNLDQFGIRGVTLRMNDKLQRLINKSWNQPTSEDKWATREDIRDDVFDLIGYCFIILINKYGLMDHFEEEAQESFDSNEKEPSPLKSD